MEREEESEVESKVDREVDREADKEAGREGWHYRLAGANAIDCDTLSHLEQTLRVKGSFLDVYAAYRGASLGSE